MSDPPKMIGVAKAIVEENKAKEPNGSTAFSNSFLSDLISRLEQAEAELAERDGTLRLAEERVLKVLPTFSPTTAKLIRKVFADLRAHAEGNARNHPAQTDRLVKLESRLAEASSLFRRMWINDQALGYESYCKVFMTAAHELLESWAERGGDPGYLKRSRRGGLASAEVSFPAKYSNRGDLIAQKHNA